MPSIHRFQGLWPFGSRHRKNNPLSFQEMPHVSMPACRLCGASSPEIWNRNDAKTGKPIQLHFCHHCGMIQQARIPESDELLAYYSHHYRQDYKGTHRPSARHVRRAGVAAINRLKLLGQWLPPDGRPRKLLDIGAGGGEFVHLAQRMGFEARGIEPNLGYSDFARTEYGAEVLTATLEQVPPGSQDLVTLFHVLEHLPDPPQALARIAGMVGDRGFVFVEVPNILQADASPHNTFFGAHLHYFCRATLSATASRHFDVVKATDSGNLSVLLRRKSRMSACITLPTPEEVVSIRTRLARKGWIEYLTVGGGLAKPFRRIAQHRAEWAVRNLKPRAILEDLARDHLCA